MYFEQTSTGIRFVRRTKTSGSVVNNLIEQSAWNVDTLDGSGKEKNPSAITLDPTKGNVFQIKYQWLGFGTIKFFIEHADDGLLHLVHTIAYANTNTTPSVDNPTLPLCLAAKNTSNTSDIVLRSGSLAGFV